MEPTFPHNRFGMSEKFTYLMRTRMQVSHYKYGTLEINYPFPANAVASLEQRLELYKQDGNIEWLVDVANFAMIEALYPANPRAHFNPNTESPGLVKDEETGN